MAGRSAVVDGLLGAVGGLLGGVAGAWLFGWAARQGFYAMLLPGGGLGLGAAIASQRPSQVRGVICGVAAVALGLAAEWWFFPFLDDASLGYFVRHLNLLTSMTWVMVAAGAALAYWLGRDAGYFASRRRIQ